MHQLDFAAQVDRGLVRETNQDVARIAPALGLVVVADGMGGHERGEVASSVAADTILSVFERLGGLDAHHSYAAELRRQGLDGSPELRATAEQYQNMLTRCIGGADEVAVDAKVLRIQPGDVLVLCSDGLWGGVGPDAISHIVQAAPSAEDACRSLISAAWQSGGLDNIGVAVVRVLPLALRDELPPEHEATSAASL